MMVVQVDKQLILEDATIISPRLLKKSEIFFICKYVYKMSHPARKMSISVTNGSINV